MRFLQAAKDANSEEQALTLCAEVDYIMYVCAYLLKLGQPLNVYISSAALTKLGERVPLAR